MQIVLAAFTALYVYVGTLVVGPAIPSHRPQNLFPSPTLKTSLAGGSLAPSISIKSFAPEVPQLADGESSEQQIESENPSSFVHDVVDVDGTLLGTFQNTQRQDISKTSLSPFSSRWSSAGLTGGTSSHP